LKPEFRKPIRSQRCLVVARAFIEGLTNEGLNKPYLIYLKNDLLLSPEFGIVGKNQRMKKL